MFTAHFTWLMTQRECFRGPIDNKAVLYDTFSVIVCLHAILMQGKEKDQEKTYRHNANFYLIFLVCCDPEM